MGAADPITGRLVAETGGRRWGVPELRVAEEPRLLGRKLAAEESAASSILGAARRRVPVLEVAERTDIVE